MGRLRWKELLDDHAALLVLLTAGAVLYGIVASVQWYNMDEGVYLNAAATITRGGVPFVTFAAREPVLLYYLAAGVAIFGPQLLVARLQMVLVDLGTAVAVYLMGRELGGKTAGIAAAGFFLFNPFDVYAFSTVLLEPLAALPLAWIAYLVLRNRRPDPVKVPLIAGLLLGIAELTRRDAILLAPVVLAALFVRLSPTLRPLFHRSSLKAAGYFLVGLALPVGVVLGIFVSLTSVPWMWGQYGLGAAYVEQVVPFPYHVGVLYYLWVYEPLLVIPAVAVPAGSLAARGHRDLAFLSLLLSAGLLGLVLYAGPPNFDWGQGEYELAATGGLLVAQLALWGVSAFDIGFSDHPGPKVPHLALLFLGLWAVIYLFFYVAVYPEFLTNYFTDVSVPLSVLAGLWWSDRIVRPLLSVQELPAVSSPRARRDQWLPMITGLVLATAVVGSGLFTAVEVLGPSNPYNEPLSYNLPQYNLIQRTYSPDLVHQVAHYLDATNTTPRTVMFSADDIFLAAAGRPNLMNLSVVLDQMAYVAYPNDQSAYPYNPYHLAPSMDYLLQVWNRTYVPYVVVGSRTSEMEVMHPILAWYLEENYHVAATFGNSMSLNYVTVWALGAPPAAPATEVHVVPTPGAPTASMAVYNLNGTVMVGSLNSSLITAISPDGRSWTFSLSSVYAGARYLAFDSSTQNLWVAEAGPGNLSSSVARYALPNGSVPVLLSVSPVGYVPDAIAFDAKRHLAAIASLADGNVTLLNSSTGAFVTTYAVGAAPDSLAVDASSGDLYVASSGEASIPVYNLSTGQLISTLYSVGASSNVVLTPGYVLATQWSPGQLVWINRTTGSVAAVEPTGDGAQGIAMGGDTVAVAGQESGNVTFYNVSTMYPEGVLSTGGCPNEIAFGKDLAHLYTAGPCPSPITEWRMAALVNFSVSLSESGGLYLDGALVPPNYPLTVFPGLHSLFTLASGYVPFGTQFYVLTAGSFDAPLGPSFVSVENTQESFTEEVTGAAGFILLATASLPLWGRGPGKTAAAARKADKVEPTPSKKREPN